MELRVVEEEKAKFTAQTETINAIAYEIAPGESLNPAVYEYIMDAVFDAQIVDEETRQTILETAKKMQDDLAAEAAEQAAAEFSDGWGENPGDEVSDEWAENSDDKVSDEWAENPDDKVSDEWAENPDEAVTGEEADWSSAPDNSADFGDWIDASDSSDWEGGYGYGDWSEGADYVDWGGGYESYDGDFAA